MASANSPILSCSARAPSATSISPRWWIASAVALAGLAVAVVAPQLASAAEIVLLVVVLCLAWQAHLQASSWPRAWSWPLSLLFGAQLALTLLLSGARLTVMFGALGSGVVACLMFWALLARHRRGLQAIASMAFLLAFALFGRPSIVFSGVFVCMAFVVASRRRFGGFAEPAVLIFTPAVLCLLLTFVLRLLDIAVIRLPALGVDLSQLLLWRYTPAHVIWLRALLPPLVFSFGAILCRLLDGRAGGVDLVYCALVLALAAGIALRPVFDQTAVLDVTMILYGGGASLIAKGPPRAFLSRLCLSLALVTPLLARL